MNEKNVAHYASKAGARTKAVNDLNSALANLAEAEKRVETAERRLDRTQGEAMAELEQALEVAERVFEEEKERARKLYYEQIHAAASEHGTAKSLVEKGRAEVEAACSALLRLMPCERILRGGEAPLGAGVDGLCAECELSDEGSEG